jgi:excisionase family DNA binding protein
MLTSTEAAQQLGLSKRTMLNLAKAGKIPCLRLPTDRGDYRFDLEEVREALRQYAEDTVIRKETE